VGGADSGLSVLDRLVRDGELAQVETHHVRLDLDLRPLMHYSEIGLKK
jgi:hypothetical protein